MSLDNFPLSARPRFTAHHQVFLDDLLFTADNESEIHNYTQNLVILTDRDRIWTYLYYLVGATHNALKVSVKICILGAFRISVLRGALWKIYGLYGKFTGLRRLRWFGFDP